MDPKVIEGINSGEFKVVKKWEYILSNWAPIITLMGILIGGIFWYANAEARMFTDQQAKVQTENYIKTAISMQEKYVTKDEFEKYIEIAKENREDIKEILKYLRK